VRSWSFFFFSSRRRHTRFSRDWSSDVCSSDLAAASALLRPLGVDVPIYPVKGYSISVPIRAGANAPAISVTDFQRKIVYARLGRSEERRVGKECRSRGGAQPGQRARRDRRAEQ